jgi:biopolymer transport protein ExbD
MAMSLGNGSGSKAEINMTPMIDVLLVLIIIFMIVIPVKSIGLRTLVPQPPAENTTQPVAPAGDIVITVHSGHTFELNREPLDFPQLQSRLQSLFRTRPPDVVFVRGDRGLEFRQVAEVIDLAHGCGVGRVALMSN